MTGMSFEMERSSTLRVKCWTLPRAGSARLYRWSGEDPKRDVRGGAVTKETKAIDGNLGAYETFELAVKLSEVTTDESGHARSGAGAAGGW
ncbi:MAG: hypothetical protein ACRDNP_11605 [Gaiellaceae bacterium]